MHVMIRFLYILGPLALTACSGAPHSPQSCDSCSADTSDRCSMNGSCRCGSEPACSGDRPRCCAGACVSLESDPLNCAECGKQCPATGPAKSHAACSAGQCGYECDSGHVSCRVGCCRAVAVAAGRYHSCALMDTGAVMCWGRNAYGQLGAGQGRGNVDRDQHASTPVPGVDGSSILSGVNAISAGAYHTCALMEGGGAKCWGGGGHGELGNNDTPEFSATPVDVWELSGATSIAAGGYHTCVLMEGGGAKCWGDARVGQIGTGVAKESQQTPTDVKGGQAFKSIAAGEFFTCGLTIDGGVRCWGRADRGQIGSGGGTNTWTACTADLDNGLGATSYACSLEPVEVSVGLPGIASIAAGTDQGCALATTGGVACWGERVDLGSEPAPSVGANVGLSGFPGAVGITAGRAHTCALAGGHVKCLGYNGAAQLGNDSTDPSQSSPVDVLVDAPIGAVGSTEWAHTCAITESGGVTCWGDNEYGQIGFPSDSLVPVDVPF